MPAGSQKISEVLYLTDDQRQHNSLRGASSEGNILTYHDNWFTRWEAEYTDAGLINIYIVPDIREKTWSTPATGKFTLLLQVEDTPGNTYYDVQRVWVDNESPIAKIRSIGGLTACKDLKLSNFVGTTAKIRGFAWDHPIEGVSPNPPNNNFREYSMGFKKNGGGSGSITAAPVTTAVPSDWPGPPAVDGVLADWDVVAAIDGGAGPVPANSPKLARGDRCAYVITLSVTDRTLVGEGGNNHHSTDLYAINVINDIT